MDIVKEKLVEKGCCKYVGVGAVLISQLSVSMSFGISFKGHWQHLKPASLMPVSVLPKVSFCFHQKS